MKFRVAVCGFVAVGAVTFSATALAQNVPAQFVVTGKAAERSRTSRPLIERPPNTLPRCARVRLPPKVCGLASWCSIRTATKYTWIAGELQTIQLGLFANSGGLPIVVDGQMIGAIGVSGSPGGDEENCAIEGLKAAFGSDVTLPVYPAATGAQ
jgi:hypothetical protein